jgi:hypothetical protein
MVDAFSLSPFSPFQIDLSLMIPDDKFLDMMDVHHTLELQKTFDNKPVIAIKPRNKTPGRVIFFNNFQVIPEENMLQAMNAFSFDPASTLYFDSSTKNMIRPAVFHVTDNEFSFEFVEYTPNRMSLSLTVPHAGFTLFSELHYPGWISNADGRILEILRGNYCFRTIQVDESVSGMDMIYYPMQFKIGLFISLMTISCIIFVRLR